MKVKKITPTIRKLFATAVFFVVANILFLWHGPRSDHPRIGPWSATDIIAPYTFAIPKDQKTIEQEETKARNAVPPVLDLVVHPAPNAPGVVPTATKRLLDSPAGPAIISRARALVEKIETEGYWPEKNSSLRPSDNPTVTIRTRTTEFSELAQNLIGQVEAESIIRLEAQRLFARDENLQTAFYYTAFSMLAPTFSYNGQETEERRQSAVRALERNKGYVLKGERIVAANEKITPEITEKLNALTLTQPRKNFFKSMLGTAVVLALVLGLGSAYLRFRKVSVWQDEMTVYLILTLGFVTFMLARLLGFFSFYLVPLGLGAILLALVVDLEVATLFAVVMGLGIGFMAGADFSLTLFLLAGALAGSYSALWIKRRVRFYYGVIAVAAGGFVAVLANAFIQQHFGLLTLHQTGYALANGLFAAGGAFLLLPLTERFFGVVAAITLTEVADLNRPLLKTMAVEAPGTYHHSIIVANLAEACAHAIHANPGLARAGGYFHDIGKLKKPEYFIENLSGKRNPHDKLTPKMSSLIISTHVKDGLDIAKRERLPKPLREIIAEHHGTTLMEPFYEKAERLRTGSAAYEFRYPGPTPRSKEAALVMIADAIEAAARAERRITASSLRRVIKETTEGRWADGQFDNCALTRQDLVKIQEALYPVLLGIFHPRVSYPKDENRGLWNKNDRSHPPAASH